MEACAEKVISHYEYSDDVYTIKGECDLICAKYQYREMTLVSSIAKLDRLLIQKNGKTIQYYENGVPMFNINIFEDA